LKIFKRRIGLIYAFPGCYGVFGFVCFAFPMSNRCQRAAAIPRKKVTAVAARTVLREIHNGDSYISVIKPASWIA
jgi:hypothetical protein